MSEFEHSRRAFASEHPTEGLRDLSAGADWHSTVEQTTTKAAEHPGVDPNVEFLGSKTLRMSVGEIPAYGSLNTWELYIQAVDTIHERVKGDPEAAGYAD